MRRRRPPERFGAMRASSKLPTEARPTRYRAPGLRAAREAAGMSVEEVAELSGYGAGLVRALEDGADAHTVAISRVASVIPGHDLRLIRGEAGAGININRIDNSIPE